MLRQLHFFSLFESFFSSSCFIIESPIIVICLSKLAYVVAELKQNVPLDHTGTVLVAVNAHFPFVHRRMVRKLHQRHQLDRQAVVQIGWR